MKVVDALARTARWLRGAHGTRSCRAARATHTSTCSPSDPSAASSRARRCSAAFCNVPVVSIVSPFAGLVDVRVLLWFALTGTCCGAFIGYRLLVERRARKPVE